MSKTGLSIIAVIGICYASSVYGQLWKSYSDSAGVLTRQEKYQEALVYYNKAKIILQPDSLSDAYIFICKKSADVYYSSGKYDDAEALYLEARKAIEKLHGSTDSAYATNSIGLGSVCSNKRQHEKAASYFAEARNIREKWYPKNSIMYAETCSLLANSNLSLGNYEQAEPLYLEAKQIIVASGDTITNAYAQCCNGLSQLYTNLGQYEKAEPLALISKQVRGRVFSTSHPSYALNCITLANLYTRMGQYEKAEPLYIEAKEIRGKKFSKTHTLYASSCIILADLYYQMGNFEKAGPLYLEAKEIRSGHPDIFNADVADACNSLGNLYTAMGEYKKAESFTLEAREIWTKILPKGHPNFAINDNTLGSIYAGLNDYKKAETYYLQARQSWKTLFGENHPYYATNASNLAELYWNERDFQKANTFYIEALQSRYTQIKKIFLFTNEREKQAYLKNINSSGDEYQSFAFKQFPSIHTGELYNISLSNRNLILSSSRQMREFVYSSGDTSLSKAYTQWMGIKQILAFKYANPKSTNAGQLKELEDEADSTEKELSKNASSVNSFQQNDISWKKIQHKLGNDEAAIEFLEFQFFDGRRWTDSSYYAALVLRKDKVEPLVVRLFEKKRLDSLLESTGNSANENISALYSRGVGIIHTNTNSAGIYKLLWQPIEKSLTGIRKIYFAPAGLLYRISFAALPVNNKQVLSDKYQLIQLNTTASILDSTAYFINDADKIYLYGAVQYDADSLTLKKAACAAQSADSLSTRSLPIDLTRGGTWNYLPGTALEIDGIRQLGNDHKLDIHAFKGPEASEESIKALNAKNFPALLHIASHGFFFPDPVIRKEDEMSISPDVNGKVFRQSDNPLFRSGLILAGANNAWISGKSIPGLEDGILTSYEVSNLYLPNIKLVVLSACETALGDIHGSEGVYGLQRAFKIAGVQYLLMSLWKVPDAETAEFMQQFYKNMFNHQSISDSFYHARDAMKMKYKKDPYKWAAWVLIK